MATTIALTSQAGTNAPYKLGSPPDFGALYSGRALEFDGVTDYVTSDIIQFLPITFAFWIYPDEWSGIHDDNAIVIGWRYTTYDQHGCFVQLTNAGLLQASCHNNATTFKNDLNYTLTKNTWQHIAVTFDTQGVTAGQNDSTSIIGTIYADGVQVDTLTAGGGLMSSATFGIGSVTDAAAYFPGKLSNVQIWDKAWSLSDVQYAYTHPEKLITDNSSVTSGTTISNLKAWYPCTEGNPRSPQTTVYDGSPKGLGSELLGDGDFTLTGTLATNTTGTYWKTDSYDFWSISGSQAILTNPSGSGVEMEEISGGSIDDTIIAGALYKVVLEIISVTGSGDFRARVGNTGGTLRSAVGTYTEYIVASNTDAFTLSSGGNDTVVIKVDNVSVKLVKMGNHGTTKFFNELAEDNAADDDTGDWTKGSGMTLAFSSDHYTATATGNNKYFYLTAATAVTSGRTYKISIDMKDGTASTISGDMGIVDDGVSFAGSPTHTSFTTGGSFATKTHTVVADATENAHIYVEIDGLAGSNIQLKNFKMEEVGVATGWTTADAEPLIPQTALMGMSKPMVFNGIDDSVSCGTVSEITAPTASYSVWFNATTVGADDGILCNNNTGNDRVGMIFSANGRLQFSGTSGSSGYHIYSDSVISTDTWYHVVYTRSLSGSYTTIKMYVNGALQADTDTSEYTQSTSINTLFIGRLSGTSAYHFEGIINEVAIHC